MTHDSPVTDGPAPPLTVPLPRRRRTYTGKALKRRQEWAAVWKQVGIEWKKQHDSKGR